MFSYRNIDYTNFNDMEVYTNLVDLRGWIG